uniref:Calcineurin B subunit n=1 Tax=Hirondellea gigas TaxID=1518452 RepID=A0A2P2IDC6_9CRUS
MGAQLSISESDVQELKVQSNFTEEELKKLHRRFQKLDLNNNGTLSTSEFLEIPALEQNPLVHRVISIFDDDESGEVDFREFINALSIFAGQDNHKEKLIFAFKLYDVNKDGFISNGDLFTVLKTMVGDNLDDLQLQQLVDRTILQADKDKDGKLSFVEFTEMVKDSGIEEKLTLDVFSDSGAITS